MPATQKDEGSRWHGPDLLPNEFDIPLPVDREANQVSLGTAEIDGTAGPLAEICDLHRPATRLQNGCDQLKPQGREEPRVEPVTFVGVDAEGMVVHRSVPPLQLFSSNFLFHCRYSWPTPRGF
ncbi:MAG: hypothetical protein ABSG44_05135 [Thermodesulfobacteriota bacterium]